MSAQAPPGTQGGNLTRDTVAGLRWTYGATAFSTIAQLGYTAVMGRLLTPADFGLVAMAAVFLRFGSYFSEMGVGSAVVQREQLTRDDVRTSFTSAVVLGGLFSVAIAVAAPLGARVFDNPNVVELIRWLSLTLLLGGAGVTARGLLRRSLRFREVALVDAGSYAVGYLAVGVAFALAGAGVWSLVAASLGQALVFAVLAYVLSPHPVAPRLHLGELRTLYAFGGRVSVIGFFEFLAVSADTFFVGAYAGASPLGQYNRALLLVNLPMDRVANGMADVLFPAFSRASAVPERVRGAYLGASRVAAALLVPLGAGLAVAAPEIVAVLLGPQWAPAASLVPLVVVASVASVLALFAAVTCEALAELDVKLALVVGHLVLLIGLLTLARGRGLAAFVLAVAVAGVVRFVLYLLLMRRALGVRLREHLAVYLPAFAAGAVTAAVILGVSVVLRGAGAPTVVTLAAQVAAGAAALLVLFWGGPLAPARREVHVRLANAGVFAAGGEHAGRWRSVLGRVLGA